MTGIFSVVPRLCTPSINPGDSVEIELFITGYGDIPKKNKFSIAYSSPFILQKDENGKVGSAESCIKGIIDIDTGKIVGMISAERTQRSCN